MPYKSSPSTGEDLDGGEIGAKYLLFCHPTKPPPSRGRIYKELFSIKIIFKSGIIKHLEITLSVPLSDLAGDSAL